MVAPNPIDFDKALTAFNDIASNPVVFATVLTIFGLYFVGMIWARWRDKKDLEKVILLSAMVFGHDTNSHQMTTSLGGTVKQYLPVIIMQSELDV